MPLTLKLNNKKSEKQRNQSLVGLTLGGIKNGTLLHHQQQQ
jgi:hypothetical protein